MNGEPGTRRSKIVRRSLSLSTGTANTNANMSGSPSADNSGANSENTSPAPELVSEPSTPQKISKKSKTLPMKLGQTPPPLHNGRQSPDEDASTEPSSNNSGDFKNSPKPGPPRSPSLIPLPLHSIPETLDEETELPKTSSPRGGKESFGKKLVRTSSAVLSKIFTKPIPKPSPSTTPDPTQRSDRASTNPDVRVTIAPEKDSALSEKISRRSHSVALPKQADFLTHSLSSAHGSPNRTKTEAQPAEPEKKKLTPMKKQGSESRMTKLTYMKRTSSAPNIHKDITKSRHNGTTEDFDAMLVNMTMQKSGRTRQEELVLEDSEPEPVTTLNDITEKVKQEQIDATSPGDAKDAIYCETNPDVILAGTSDKLFSLLADHKVQDKEYISVYLSTHQYFITADELMTKLIHYYKNPLPPNTKLDKAESEQYLNLVQMRLINVFKKWLHYEFECDFISEDICHQFEAFLAYLGAHEQEQQQQRGTFLNSIWKNRALTQHEMFDFDSNPPKALVPKRANSFLDMEPIEFARQLTLRHQKMFFKIRNPDLFGTEKLVDPEHIIVKISTCSQKFVQFVSLEILHAPSTKKRTETIQNFITICWRLCDLHNFHGAMDVFLGLVNHSVFKMKRSWKNLSRTCEDRWAKLQTLFDLRGSFKNLRNRVKQTKSPLLVPPSIWQHDIIHVEENNTFYEETQLYNFEKCRLLNVVFKEVYKCQLQPYNITEVASIQAFLDKQMAQDVLDEETLDSILSKSIGYAQEVKKLNHHRKTSSGTTSSQSAQPTPSPQRPDPLPESDGKDDDLPLDTNKEVTAEDAGDGESISSYSPTSLSALQTPPRHSIKMDSSSSSLVSEGSQTFSDGDAMSTNSAQSPPTPTPTPASPKSKQALMKKRNSFSNLISKVIGKKEK